MPEAELISISDVREATGQPDHVINHAIKRHGPEPVGRIGITRVWRREQLQEIERSIKRTTEQRRDPFGLGIIGTPEGRAELEAGMARTTGFTREQIAGMQSGMKRTLGRAVTGATDAR